MEQNYDIIIIGGGLLGCATAYQLSKRNAGKILLLDGNEIASQASARAACLLTRARTKPALMELVQETYDCIKEIEVLLDESLELQQCGSVTIASSDLHCIHLCSTLLPYCNLKSFIQIIASYLY